jgi:multiple sugar transport system permease protein
MPETTTTTTVSEEILAKAKKQGSLGYLLKKNRESYFLMAPYFILFTFFTILPVAMSVAFSFTYYNMLEVPTFIGWKNYIKLFLEDDIFLISLKNTLILALVTGPISYFMCLLFAWIINEFKGWLRAFLTLIFYAPSISGNAYIVWRLILSGDRYGYLNGILLDWGIIDEPILWLLTPQWIMPALIVVQLWLSLGTGFLAFIAGLQTVDKTLYEAGAIDGIKNRWQELWYITLPAMKPQLMFGAIMQITNAFAIADVSIQLMGNPSANYAGATVVTHLLDYGTVRFEMGYASAIATVLFFLMIGTNQIVQKLLRRVGA